MKISGEEVTEEMKEKINFWLNELKEEALTYHLITHPNSFTAVAILKVPFDHHKYKMANTIRIVQVGSNDDYSDVEQQANIVVNLEEAEELETCLRRVIARYKKFIKKEGVWKYSTEEEDNLRKMIKEGEKNE